jgi:hypothetical protein
MARLKGTVRHLDLEGGLWVLEADDGKRYQLEGGGGGLRRDGQRVTVEGEVDEGAFTIGMTGPVLSVRRFSVD